MTIDNIYDVYTLYREREREYKRRHMFAWFLVEFLEMLQREQKVWAQVQLAALRKMFEDAGLAERKGLRVAA